MPEILSFVLIIFLATFIRSALGFGNALISMPLLLLVTDFATATPLTGLNSVMIGLSIITASWKKVEWTSVWRLLIAAAAGIPLGILLVKQLPQNVLKSVLAVLLMVVSLNNLFAPRLPRLHRINWAFAFGFLSGVLGGAYNVNGPPAVVFGTLRRWSPVEFRATMQGFFVPSALFIAAGHGITGLWSVHIWKLFLITLPAAVVAILVGARVNRRIPAHLFDRYVYGFLLIMGIYLLF